MRRENDEGGMTGVDLPTGWVAASFSQVAKARMGPTILAKDLSESGLPVYSAGKANTAWGFTKRDVPVFPNGTIVVSARGSIGFPKIPKESSFTSTQTTIAITPSAAIGTAYLQRYLQSSDWAEMSSGAAIPMLTISMLNDLAVPLPPFAEQKRIADKLESVLGRVDTCRARLDRVPALLKRFRQSVLANATSGGLTAEWRMTNGVSDEWENTDLLNICSSISDGDHLPPPQTATGIPFLTIGNISSGQLDFANVRYVPETYFEKIRATRVPKPGDTLYSVVGASIGIPVMVEVDRKFCFQRHIAILKPSEGTSPSFLHILMASPEVFREAWSRTTGTAQPTLPLGALRTIPVSLPTLPEQQEIVRRVEDLFAFADRIEARLATAQKTVERLTPATLAKAFRGELVPQDPNDEPASALLERINGQVNGTTPKASRGRRAKCGAA